jgi:hypothetical protein
MAYTGEYINELVITLPAGTEDKSFGDNAIREIKKVLQTTFPNVVSGEVFDGTIEDLNAAVAGAVPRGAICPWAGDFGVFPDGPDGWTICDGRARKSGGGTSPNLIGKFIWGAVPDGTPNPFAPYLAYRDQTGGLTELDIKVLATGAYKNYTSNATTLTANQSGLPSHTHSVATHIHSGGGGLDGGSSGYGLSATTLTTGSAGGSSASSGHTHTFKIEADFANPTLGNMPPYYTLVYIIKD